MKDQLQRRDSDDGTLQGNAQKDAEQEFFVCKKSDLKKRMVAAHVQGVNQL